MTPTEKLDAVLKWFATSPFAQAPSNTDADIDYHMKKQYPDLNTVSGDWGLHKILDKLIKDGYVSYQDREISENDKIRLQRWYQITFDGEEFIRNNGYRQTQNSTHMVTTGLKNSILTYLIENQEDLYVSVDGEKLARQLNTTGTIVLGIIQDLSRRGLLEMLQMGGYHVGCHLDINIFDFHKIGGYSNNERTSAVGISTRKVIDKKKVFIVHGHDNEAKTEVARFIERLGFDPIILHEQANGGKTIIEKIEAFTNVGFGIVLYTPCDEGAVLGKREALKPRARQNVLLEHGYLMGKLERNRVCALVKGNIDLPTDISGIAYTEMDAHMAWQYKVAKEMKEAGYPVDMNKL